MTTPVTTLKVYYDDKGKSVSKTITFKGNFGFSLDGKKYKAENGNVYNEDGKLIQGLKMPLKMAHQFIGMSNTAEMAQDYTFSEKDITDAQKYFSTYNKDNTRINSIVGAASDGFKNGYASYQNGKYISQYRNTVSVWQIK